MTVQNEKKERPLIQLRTTAEEKRTLREYAKLAGMTITDYVKLCTLSKPPRTKMATPLREALLLLHGELGKIGSNVNQIAKVMNTDKKAFYSVSVKETLIAQTLEDIRKVCSQILDVLDNKKENGIEGENQG